jgi:Na+/H+ antiporter NhaC
LTAVLVVLVLLAFDLPVLGALAGVGVFIAVLVQDVPLLLGAYAGAEL